MKKGVPRTVLIVKFEALGDALRTNSLVRPLADSGARVTFLTSPAALPLLRATPRLAAALGLRLDDPTAVAAMKARLAGRFDLVLSLEEHPAAAAVAAAACRGELLGVRDEGGRLGYTPSSARYYDMSLLHRDADGGHAAADAVKKANRDTYAGIWLKLLGLAPRERPVPALRLTARDRAAARRLAGRRLLRGRGPVLGLNPGAGARWPGKQLSVEKAARLLLALRAAFGGPLLLIGRKDDAEAERNALIAETALRRDPSLPIVTHPRLPLRSFAGVVELCDALVTTDSLAAHVAAAVGVPVACLVGPTCAQELDLAPGSSTLTPPTGCSCFYAANCSRPVPCLDDVPDAAVVAAVRRCLR
ncbi:MAG: glycosyltransferase family 9 protein [Elusimicrobiota bacterium]|nr:glycosyltransferase family 9 protein [Elusimicrobiota bacterium]